ncbi:MAG: hypothetical protein AAF944_15060 [Bacteroidota bacterium]
MIRLILFGSLLLLTGCPGFTDIGEPLEPAYTQYSPIMMERSQMEAAIGQLPAREIQDAGKIYAYGNYLFISEKFQGIHVIDNERPERPINQGFIRIPGCVDMAVKGTTLFADNATDLIGIDISDPTNVHEISRVRNAFPVLLPPDLGEVPETYQNRSEDLVIIEWRR